MDTEEKPTSGAEGGEGGADASEKNTNPETNSEPDKKPDVVSRKAYDSVANDMHRFKREASELRQKFTDLEAKKLADDKNYQQLYENEKKRTADLEADNQKKDNYYIHTQKSSEIQKLAMANGLRSEAVADLELLDFNGVEIEVTSTGRYNVLGAKEFVDRLKNSKPHWFNRDKAPKVNHGGGGAPPGEPKSLTPGDVVNAERRWKAGKISKEDYYGVFKKYAEQKKQKTV